jgi:preprotein translocase subunit SecD
MLKAGLEISLLQAEVAKHETVSGKQVSFLKYSFDPKEPNNAETIERLLKVVTRATLEELLVKGTKLEAQLWAFEQKQHATPSILRGMHCEIYVNRLKCIEKKTQAENKVKLAIKRAEFEDNQKRSRLLFQQELLAHKLASQRKHSLRAASDEALQIAEEVDELDLGHESEAPDDAESVVD